MINSTRYRGAPRRQNRNKRSTAPIGLRKEAGFSLLELLVVVTILALLIALLVPALSGAKSSAKKASCLLRIRGLGVATSTYLAESDDRFPINGLLFPKAEVPKMYSNTVRFTDEEVTNPEYWRPEYGALWHILGGSEPTIDPPLPMMQGPLAKAYLCPEDDLVRTSTGALTFEIKGNVASVQIGPGNRGYWSYSVNSVLNSLGRIRNSFPSNPPWTDPMKASIVARPSEFIVFVEESSSSLFNDEVFDSPAFNHGDRLTSRHKNGGNVSYLDGHVEWFSDIAFNEVPSYASGSAWASPVTRMFFPDGGDFLGH